MEGCVTQINDTFGGDGWMPVIYRPQHHQPEDVAHMYRAADVCVVSSLHDGMNLVAKEFIASRTDEHGVLVLSEFTGAARELEQAVHVNPFAVDAFADALHAALIDVARGSAPADAGAARAGRLAHRVRLGQRAADDGLPDGAGAAMSSAEAAAWTPLPLHHGAIGNGRVLALVGPDTNIDWLCLPRFDSPSVFARLLDQERGGTWAFKPVDDWKSNAAYIRNTNVLRTEIETADGVFEVCDFAPRLLQGLKVDAPIEICRAAAPAVRLAAGADAFRSASGLRARQHRDRAVRTGPRSGRRPDALVSVRPTSPRAVRARRQRDSNRSADLLFA